MSDTEMNMGDTASEAQADSFDDNGAAVEGRSRLVDDSMSSGAENETHDEDDDSEDEEALVEIDPKAILPVKIRPNAGKVNYASQEAYEKAGLTPADVEKEELEDDGEFVSLEDVEEEHTGDTMQT
ncbi:hypothetical protein M408DRAFT_21444 [Serendipita vermifera MAFF 305830]|uniref:Histone chaperone domain-containing protein n=1 Tax=Serendipita vermifera MAFF 305830 TaxID=933852 RepID=A0A0C3BIR0_SERVB|nr:hypothetical protein M408DRAFT_21444 [Serendipita vermifera MAFF 305830]